MIYHEHPNEDEFRKLEKLVRERYAEFGGLPRYLINHEKARERRARMTAEKRQGSPKASAFRLNVRSNR